MRKKAMEVLVLLVSSIMLIGCTGGKGEVQKAKQCEGITQPEVLYMGDNLSYVQNYELDEAGGRTLYQWKESGWDKVCEMQENGSYWIEPETEDIYYYSSNENTPGIWKWNQEKASAEQISTEAIGGLFLIDKTVYASKIAAADSDMVEILQQDANGSFVSWSEVGTDKADDYVLTNLTEWNGHLLATTTYALYESSDQGLNWTTIYTDKETIGPLVCTKDKVYFAANLMEGWCEYNGEAVTEERFPQDNAEIANSIIEQSILTADGSQWILKIYNEDTTESRLVVYDVSAEAMDAPEKTILLEDTEKTIGIKDGIYYVCQ